MPERSILSSISTLSCLPVTFKSTIISLITSESTPWCEVGDLIGERERIVRDKRYCRLESFRAFDPHELSEIASSCSEGDPIGSFIQPSIRPLTSSKPYSWLYDQTHDNPSQIQRRSVEDALPRSAVVAMSNCSTGSTRGYDELVPQHIDVVHENRLYSQWVRAYHHSPQYINEKTGIIQVKKALNKLHIDLAQQGFTQVCSPFISLKSWMKRQTFSRSWWSIKSLVQWSWWHVTILKHTSPFFSSPINPSIKWMKSGNTSLRWPSKASSIKSCWKRSHLILETSNLSNASRNRRTSSMDWNTRRSISKRIFTSKKADAFGWLHRILRIIRDFVRLNSPNSFVRVRLSFWRSLCFHRFVSRSCRWNKCSINTINAPATSIRLCRNWLLSIFNVFSIDRQRKNKPTAKDSICTTSRSSVRCSTAVCKDRCPSWKRFVCIINWNIRLWLIWNKAIG